MGNNDKDDKANFTICNDIWDRIISKYGDYFGTNDYSEKEKVVVFVWAATDIIESGGFEYLFAYNFPNDNSYEETIKAFETIGCLEDVIIFNDVKKLFPNSKIPLDIELRMKIFMEVPEDIRDELEIRFYDTNSEIKEKLADYIKREFEETG